MRSHECFYTSSFFLFTFLHRIPFLIPSFFPPPFLLPLVFLLFFFSIPLSPRPLPFCVFLLLCDSFSQCFSSLYPCFLASFPLPSHSSSIALLLLSSPSSHPFLPPSSLFLPSLSSPLPPLLLFFLSSFNPPPVDKVTQRTIKQQQHTQYNSLSLHSFLLSLARSQARE